MNAIPYARDYEETLINILDTLSIERVEQVIDYARFLKTLELAQRGVLHEDETEEEVQADNEKWDKTFAASPEKLKRLARQARKEIQAGRVMDMIFTDDGKIVPDRCSNPSGTL